MSFRVKCAAALITIASAAPLAAQQNYNFEFTDSSNALLLSGTLTTDPTVNDLAGGIHSNTITGMTGTYLGQSITFAPNPNAPAPFTVSTFTANDQLLLNGATLLDDFGLVFQSAAAPGDGYANLLGVGPGEYAILTANRGFIVGNFTIAQVPEPATWAMMLIGFGAIGLSLRFRRNRRALA